MKRLLRVCAVAMVLVGAPLAASAQTALADDDHNGLISAGALAGSTMDNSNNWLMFGADARVQVSHALEVEPRVTYRPLDGGHVMQLDANVLKNFDLAQPGRFRPFFGVGGAIRSIGIDGLPGSTKVGLNLLSGARIALSSSSGYEPFVTGQYTMVRGQGNDFSIVVGASFRLRH